MLVVKEHKKLLLNLNEPERITGIIPKAKLVNIKGHDIVSVPHDQDTVRVLRNMGIDAPGPIRSYYDWPGRFTPFAHQYETAEFLSLNPRCYSLLDMGTGKTASSLWAFDFLKKTGEVDWCLVISPLSTLERTWGDEIFRNFADMSFGVVHGTSERRMKVAKADYDVYIINHDGIKNKPILDHFAKKEGVGLIIIDELAVFRTAGTDRWRYLNQLVNGNSKLGLPPKKWVWGLTGTPIPNEPTDAWAQCKLIMPGSVPKTFTSFRDLTMKQLTQFKWCSRQGALDTVHRVMQPAIRFKREDCVDLPPTTFISRSVELTREQDKMYKEMLGKLKAEFAGGQVTAANEAVKLMRLVQIAIGGAYDQSGDVVEVPAQPRIDAVVELIEQAHTKTIVFVPYLGALNILAEELGKRYKVAVVHGGVSKGERDTIYSEFMSPAGPEVIVAQPNCMAHGLTLTAASCIVWYGPINSAEIMQQANARIVRPGQKHNTIIATLSATEVERKMYARLERRESIQGTLLGMFE